LELSIWFRAIRCHRLLQWEKGIDWSGLEALKLTELLMDWEADGAISALKAEGYQCAPF
tara:strand:+ start:27874 stop:28050 length:177 start_codon:yes stop_codon:yes gene_type:complete